MIDRTADWMLVVEHGAALSPYDENVAADPGVGTCVRSDGVAGPLEALVPAGWTLVDVGNEIVTGDGCRSRVYVVRADDVSCHLEYARPSTRHRVVGGRLRLAKP